MWIPILLTTMVAVLVVGEVAVLEDKVIQVVDTLVDQEEEVRVKRGAVDHEEGSGAGLLGSSFPDYGIDDEDQVKQVLVRKNNDKLSKCCKIILIHRGTNTEAQTLCRAELFPLLPRPFSRFRLRLGRRGDLPALAFVFMIRSLIFITIKRRHSLCWQLTSWKWSSCFPQQLSVW